MRKEVAIAVLVLPAVLSVYAAVQTVPAFPGAEGFDADTPGGRRGHVTTVTNLNRRGRTQ
jgi:hypothetical protein